MLYREIIAVCFEINTKHSGPGWLSRHSDSLRAGWSGDRIQVGGEVFHTRHFCREAHPSSCTMGTGSLPGVKRQVSGVYRPPSV